MYRCNLEARYTVVARDSLYDSAFPCFAEAIRVSIFHCDIHGTYCSFLSSLGKHILWTLEIFVLCSFALTSLASRAKLRGYKFLSYVNLQYMMYFPIQVQPMSDVSLLVSCFHGKAACRCHQGFTFTISARRVTTAMEQGEVAECKGNPPSKASGAHTPPALFGRAQLKPRFHR